MTATSMDADQDIDVGVLHDSDTKALHGLRGQVCSLPSWDSFQGSVLLASKLHAVILTTLKLNVYSLPETRISRNISTSTSNAGKSFYITMLRTVNKLIDRYLSAYYSYQRCKNLAMFKEKLVYRLRSAALLSQYHDCKGHE